MNDDKWTFPFTVQIWHFIKIFNHNHQPADSFQYLLRASTQRSVVTTQFLQYPHIVQSHYYLQLT